MRATVYNALYADDYVWLKRTQQLELLALPALPFVVSPITALTRHEIARERPSALGPKVRILVVCQGSFRPVVRADRTVQSTTGYQGYSSVTYQANF